MKIKAPLVPPAARAGQFIIVRADERSERIPLTIMDSSVEEGTIDIVFQVVGTSTAKLERLEEGDCLHDVAGPLGRPSVITCSDETGVPGYVVCIGGGVGIAAIYPMIREYLAAGSEVGVVLGSRDREHLILVEKIRALGVKVDIATNDGSVGEKGFVTDLFAKLVEDRKPDRVVAVGPVPMMSAVSEQTRRYGIPCVVSLSAIMVDGIGMCGSCRCEVGGNTRFACVDGPEFDAHEVDFAMLEQRLAAYKEEETESMDLFRKTMEARS